MTTPIISSEISSAAAVHLNVLDEFIAVVDARLAGTLTPFVRDSLGDLLSSLTEQRDSYLAFVAPLVEIAA